MNLPLIVLFICLSYTACRAQKAQPLGTQSGKAKKLFEEAQTYFQAKQDNKAKPLLIKATEIDPQFFEAQLMLAEIYREDADCEQAIPRFTAALNADAQKFPRAFLNCAECMIKLMRYEDAEQMALRFLELENKGRDINKAKFLLESARIGRASMANPYPFNPQNMGPNINSPYNDYPPSFTADGQYLIFTRLRPADEFTTTRSAWEEDFFESRKLDGIWSLAKPVGPPVNSGGNEGAGHISSDGNTLVFTACNRKGGLGSCDIYVTEKRNGQWVAPQNLGELVNSSDWDVQPSISADGCSMFFVSKRNGGKGKGDIWVSKREPYGLWQPPVNLGDSVNTDQDECSPFIHADGQTLYFASNGHPGLGGYDLFMSRLRPNGKWGKPVNLGYPINNGGDQLSLTVLANGALAYYSTDSYPTDANGEQKGFGKMDIFEFELPQTFRPAAVSHIKGLIIDAENNQPIEARFEITDLQTGKLKAASISNGKDGSFLLALPTGSRLAFNAEAKGYLFYSENIQIDEPQAKGRAESITIKMEKIKSGNVMRLNNVFYATASATLDSISHRELDKLVNLMKLNPSLKAEISGHTDNVGSVENNLRLSEQRALSVKSYLIQKGIEENRLQHKGYGATKPVADNTTNTGRALNRRTEFKVLN